MRRASLAAALVAPAGLVALPPAASLNRGFLLRRDLLPGPSFVRWPGDATLTPAPPEAVIWP